MPEPAGIVEAQKHAPTCHTTHPPGGQAIYPPSNPTTLPTAEQQCVQQQTDVFASQNLVGPPSAKSTHPPRTDQSNTAIQQCGSTYGSIPVREDSSLVGWLLSVEDPAGNGGSFVIVYDHHINVGKRASRPPLSNHPPRPTHSILADTWFRRCSRAHVLCVLPWRFARCCCCCCALVVNIIIPGGI